MKNRFFFIIILVLLSVISLPIILSLAPCQCSSWQDCFFIGLENHFCDEYWIYGPGCAGGDGEGICYPCRAEGQTCYLEYLSDPQCCSGECVGPYVAGKESGGYNIGTQGHCCPTGSVWAGDGCIKLVVTPPSRDFGTVEIGSCSTRNFDITNTGTGTLTGSASVSAPFSCDSGCDYTLTGGQTETVKIEFCPINDITYSRTVSFSGGGGATATVTGEGKKPAVYYTLSVSKSGTGSGTVTGSGINCGTDCSETYIEGTSVTLTASAATGSTFAGWSGACSGTGSCIVTMTAAKTVTATFNSVPTGPYTLTVSKTGTGSGTVTSSPAGINCGSDCSESYSSGTSVSLYADAVIGSTFAGWSGACSGTGSCIVLMNSGKSVTATFTLDEPPATECDLTSADWSSTEVTEGTTVEMNVQGNDCTNEALSFNIYRGSTYITTIYEVFPLSSWTAGPTSSTLYYFIAKVVDNPSESATSNNLLVTTGDTPEYCDLITICSQYEIENDCNSNVCEIDVQNSVPGVDCGDPNINCECIWEDNECKASWSGGGGVCGDGNIDTGETCDGSNWGSITGCSNFDDFTGGDLACINCQFDTSLCTGGSGGYCGDGIVGAGETCDGSDWGPITGCTNFDAFTGGTLSCGTDCQFDTSLCIDSSGVCGDGNINIGEQCDGSSWGPITGCTNFDDFTGGDLACINCQFDTSQCVGGPGGYCTNGIIDAGETCDGSDWGPITGCTNFDDFTGGTLDCGVDCLFDTSECTGPGTGAEVGTCIYIQYTDDDCDDGFLTFSWTAEWVWDPGCDLTCQQENQNLTLQCVDGQKTVECPAQIPLPFFNIYSFIATLVIIVIIYFVMSSLKKKR